MSEQEVPEHVLNGAREMRQWYEAYLAEGFSHEDALRFCARPFVVIPMPVSDVLQQAYGRPSGEPDTWTA